MVFLFIYMPPDHGIVAGRYGLLAAAIVVTGICLCRSHFS